MSCSDTLNNTIMAIMYTEAVAQIHRHPSRLGHAHSSQSSDSAKLKQLRSLRHGTRMTVLLFARKLREPSAVNSSSHQDLQGCADARSAASNVSSRVSWLRALGPRLSRTRRLSAMPGSAPQLGPPRIRQPGLTPPGLGECTTKKKKQSIE